MQEALVEREAELVLLGTALERAGDGSGSVVLVSGEAGIGKTSLVRAFVRSASGRARVLMGACDDLLTPRVFGPLRDAVRSGPLADALVTGDRESVLSALLSELSDAARPAALVVEDVHWADDATLDALRFVSRRVVDLPAVLVVTYRDDEIDRDHPLQRVLGVIRGPGAHRLALRRLSRVGVARLAGGTAATSAPLYALTAGNPFFVIEALAASGADVPATVVDAVLARVHRLGPAAQAALDQLAVVPSRVELPLAHALLGDLAVLAEAEQHNVLELDPQAIRFRHELARRAVEGSLPVSMRMQLNARVLSTLLAGDDTDPARIVHHSVEAGDDALVIQYAPAAARRANRAGAHAQEVALYRQVLARSHLLSDDQRAEALQATAIALFTTDRLRPALAAGQEAVAIRERLGEPAALGEALIALAPIQWVMAQSQASVSTAERAVRLLEPEAGGPRHTFALIYYGLLLTAVDRCDAAQPVAADAVAAAQGLGSAELEALALVLQGWARLRRRDDAGLAEMTDGVHRAVIVQQHLYGMIGYVLIVQELWRLGRFDEVERFVAAGSAYSHERDLDYYRDHLVAHRLRLQALRGEWNTAEAGLRGLGDDRVDPEVGGAPHWLPSLARLLVRRGADDADDVLDQAWDYARRADSLLELVPAALALLERAWLTGEPAPVDARPLVLSRTNEVGRERLRGEMLRWLHRLAEPAAPFDGCPEEFAAGLRGDWRAAASAWQEIGDPYEQALELLGSGEVEPTLEALTILDGLGATPAARLARQRLRELGLRQVPRGPQPVTRANPAGLTARQVEILRLLAQGLTNQEIAARLVVSVRTVDHHVSAVLQKLGVSGRREAAAAADRWGIGGGAGDAL